MAKLYPPHIEGTIPAFTGTVLTVPFSMNQAVNANEVYGMALKIKKVNSNEVIITKLTVNYNVYSDCKAVFNFTEKEQELFRVGQYYRIQLAYINSTNEQGYFSTVGVIKYTALPQVEIVGLNNMTSNLHIYEYVGTYTQKDDPTEKLYSSRLKLYDSSDNLIEDTGDIVHSVLNDLVPNQALEYFEILNDLNFSETYRLQLTMTSINGIVVSSPRYRIIQRENSDLKFDEVKGLSLRAHSNADHGFSEITIAPIDPKQEVISGFFILSRSEVKEPHRWRKIHRFAAKSDLIRNIKLTDYTVEQGKEYIYSLQQYNNYGVFSNRLVSNPIYADFEDTYLLDGERQLKIRFNPKISSLKDNILETKTNTIGSRYPFITRNGRVNHKEFSISGLISYQMDDSRSFMSWKELGIDQNITNLTAENINAERVFKLEVLNWLNDGKPKILKSPVEGNYIVRLMNVSLSPNDTVGRMLHNFSCNATEIAPFDYDALTKYNFIGLQEPDKIVSKWKTINFAETVIGEDGKTTIEYKHGELLQGLYIYSIKITDMIPGSVIYINNEPFYIGATGAFMAKTSSPIYSFRLPDDAQYSGSLIVEYKDVLNTEFDDIRAINLVENPCRQIVGNTYWKLGGGSSYINLIKALQDVKTEVVGIPKIRFIKRGVHKIYAKYEHGKTITESTTFYTNGNSTAIEYVLDKTKLDPLSLYEIHYSTVGLRVKDSRVHPNLNQDLTYEYVVDGKVVKEIKPYTETYYDPQYKKIIEDSFDLFDICINQNWINIEDTEEREIKDFDFKYISMGDGVMCEMILLTQVLDYAYEFEDEKVAPLRKAYDEAYKVYLTNVESKLYNGNLDQDLLELKELYKRLLVAVELAIVERYTEGG